MINKIKKFRLENKKYRRLHLPIIFILFLLMDIGMVSITALDAGFQSRMNQPESYAWLKLIDSYLMAKLIFTPTLLSVVISRIVDIENIGDMWKVLKTSGWTMSEIFDIKLLSIFIRYSIFQVVEWTLFIIVGKKVGINLPIPIERFTIILFSIIAISFAIITIHYFLAIRYENQLIGLSFGVCGSLAGIIGTFLPLSISRLIPYSYYAHMITIEYIEVGERQWVSNIVSLRLYPLLASLLLGGLVFFWSRRKMKVLDF